MNVGHYGPIIQNVRDSDKLYESFVKFFLLIVFNLCTNQHQGLVPVVVIQMTQDAKQTDAEASTNVERAQHNQTVPNVLKNHTNYVISFQREWKKYIILSSPVVRPHALSVESCLRTQYKYV